jgi:glycosyltransferase involved in cell wall biosynthesis
VGHLRAIKDPFRAALAARRLPPDSRVRILQVGRALTPQMEIRARREERDNPRYRWIGEVSHARAMRIIARAHVVVVSSRHEGGPNVISEAVACGTPVLATRIPGNVGLLGRDYPGYFRPGDTSALARLLRRLETDGEFYTLLAQRIRAIASRFRPECERDRLVRVILEVAG